MARLREEQSGAHARGRKPRKPGGPLVHNGRISDRSLVRVSFGHISIALGEPVQRGNRLVMNFARMFRGVRMLPIAG